ncbi:universal stress protein [Desulforamulus hydrothermalis]|uniref:Universal stress protein n=1 Tax=Desulforamulus hydrothermalis Lam5 = DSM 18033 TaxID=1121428 RepID=K8DWW2_9FIRM|nr:universal stress protein [Desulforamulus hydrothermalis]CCO06982.1 UspA domain protein [Desulforamulus hydrothermalis Lam5 = DSM 18033]SHG98324.1 Nucleotide-binding universal stress protein, UspA family [Desulforamulus hydrothermalis Lam5 = DSM 18033]
MYKKILVPLDGSERARKALSHAVELAAKLAAKITLMHVVPSLPPYVNTAVDRLGQAQQAIVEELMKNGQELLDQYISMFSGNNIAVDTFIVMGQPADEILEKARAENYDLIILGSRGLGEIKGYLMGSVSNRVSRHASCPVLIIR